SPTASTGSGRRPPAAGTLTVERRMTASAEKSRRMWISLCALLGPAPGIDVERHPGLAVPARGDALEAGADGVGIDVVIEGDVGQLLGHQLQDVDQHLLALGGVDGGEIQMVEAVALGVAVAAAIRALPAVALVRNRIGGVVEAL